MSNTVDDITISYEEDGVELVRELDKVILSKGAWTTILFRYQNLNRSTGEFGPDMYSIRRYQKRQGNYIPKSKFNISSSKQAEKIASSLQKWVEDQN
jgi:hypothetical protein